MIINTSKADIIHHAFQVNANCQVFMIIVTVRFRCDIDAALNSRHVRVFIFSCFSLLENVVENTNTIA